MTKDILDGSKARLTGLDKADIFNRLRRKRAFQGVLEKCRVLMKDGGYSVHKAMFSTKNSGCGLHALTKLFLETVEEEWMDQAG